MFVESIEPRNVREFFARHEAQLSPREIFKTKTAGRLSRGAYQSDFVDIGLLPAVEAEVGDRLAACVERAIAELTTAFPQKQEKFDRDERRWILESTFLMLAGKILRDKSSDGILQEFKDLDLGDVGQVFRSVASHYRSDAPPVIETAMQLDAAQRAMLHFARFQYLGHITTDTLADVYEKSLIDPKVRKQLGTHSTPSFIVDWIVWQMLPWIEEMELEDRHVFEPACGHAPFLVSAMRMLRFLLPAKTPTRTVHSYLKRHLHGLDMDDRAREVARLSLTLADVPNPNGWDLKLGNMFRPGVLEARAAKTQILLCNPPFEEFTTFERSQLANTTKFAGKASELLHRTLPHLPDGAVVGLVLPQGVLQNPSQPAVELRKYLLTHFQVAELCLLNDRFFRYADHETALVVARKTSSKALRGHQMTFRKVREEGTDNFAKNYTTSAPYRVPQVDVAISEKATLWFPDLPQVWEFCSHLPRLQHRADVKRGLEYKSRRRLGPGAFTFSDCPRSGAPATAIEGFAKTSKASRIDGLPPRTFMNLDPAVIATPRGGADTSKPQILLSYVRVSRGPWRWKGFIDSVGRPFENRFLAVRPHKSTLPLEYWWAVLNGPLANAFLFCHTMKRENLKGLVERIPVPRVNARMAKRVVDAAHAYLAEAAKPQSDDDGLGLFSQVQATDVMDSARLRGLLLKVDAEVLRLYDLPSNQERELLDLFSGRSRPGLPTGVAFDRFYPRQFERRVPLHIYLSEAYQRRRAEGAAAILTDGERSRLASLYSASRIRRLGPDERTELEDLLIAFDADAYVTSGEAFADLANSLEAARQKADHKINRVVDQIVSGDLKANKRDKA